jgi:hypothetical protein
LNERNTDTVEESLLLTTEAVITQIPEENTHAAMSGGGMGAGLY